jgi:SAM-dependent methyltransferase
VTPPPRRPRWIGYARKLFVDAMYDNVAQMRAALTDGRAHIGTRLLDLGCGDGELLMGYAPQGATLEAIEQSEELATRATARGVRVIVTDLDQRFPFDDATFDAVTSNQVIEHVVDTDHFVAETRRVLRPGGVAVISTENLASWHNIAALFLGWQAFSLTNVSGVRAGLGNPLANLRVDEPLDSQWTHRRIFSYRGLRELFEAHGFESVVMRGAGYYPLPARLGHVDARHAAFLTVSARRPH